MTAHPTRRPFDVGTDFHIANTTLEAVSENHPISLLRWVGVGFVFLWFFVGGIAHFFATDIEMRIVPAHIPWPRAVVLVSGVFELLGAAGLLFASTRRVAGAGAVPVDSDLGLVAAAADPSGVAGADCVVHRRRWEHREGCSIGLVCSGTPGSVVRVVHVCRRRRALEGFVGDYDGT